MRRGTMCALVIATAMTSVAILQATTTLARDAEAASAPAAAGDYTQDQARTGRQIYAQHCAQCHGGNLHGKAGPPLAGSQFADNLRFSKMSGQQFYHFIKTQMPANAPGSLKDAQYRDVLAYLLSQNHYPAGAKPLTSDSIANVKLLPYPGSGSAKNTSGKTTSGRTSSGKTSSGSSH